MNVEINWNSIFSIELFILLWGETEKLFSKILTHSLLSLKYMMAPGNIIFFDVSFVFLMVKSDEKKSYNFYLNKLRSIPFILTANHVVVEQLKSKENLIF